MKKFSLLFAWFFSAALSSTAIQAQETPTALPPPQYHGSIVYVTGGIGSDETAAFRRVRSKYSLSLNFSAHTSDGRAAFVSDVQVVVRDQHDSNTVLNITSEGPFCLIQLPAGSYTLHSTYEGVTQTRKITIQENKNTALDLNWPAKP
ncbi:carboxypeptidase-like regulatory domain-containing protein [Paenalcaligenes sp. Me131]|uniref:carboxypeptidase-like regulatory domain-containing protein n=1 Tax=Paenalcaligenes sp. Me131 TaxID=3392636 RepID=UPI003D27F570